MAHSKPLGPLAAALDGAILRTLRQILRAIAVILSALDHNDLRGELIRNVLLARGFRLKQRYAVGFTGQLRFQVCRNARSYLLERCREN